MVIPTSQTGLLVDPEEMVERIAGLADIFVITAMDAGWAFSDTMPDGTTVYGGAVRSYRPEQLGRAVLTVYSDEDARRALKWVVRDVESMMPLLPATTPLIPPPHPSRPRTSCAAPSPASAAPTPPWLWSKIISVAVEVLIGVSERMSAREMRRLRGGPSGTDQWIEHPEHGTTWRVNVRTGSASARRMHFWRSREGKIVFAASGSTTTWRCEPAVLAQAARSAPAGKQPRPGLGG